MIICTTGFAGKGLREFIAGLKAAGVVKVIDVRLHNTSRLAGYAKKDDLAYILELVRIAYEHHPELAPTEEILSDYKAKKIGWAEYERRFQELLAARQPLEDSPLLRERGPVCLLCAEQRPAYCHRRLVAEHLAALLPGAVVRHH